MSAVGVDLEMQEFVSCIGFRTDGGDLRACCDSVADRNPTAIGSEYVDGIEVRVGDRHRPKSSALEIVCATNGSGHNSIYRSTWIGGEVDAGVESTRARAVAITDRKVLPIDRQSRTGFNWVEVTAYTPLVVGLQQADLVQRIAE